jgi:hypothetical protein
MRNIAVTVHAIPVSVHLAGSDGIDRLGVAADAVLLDDGLRRRHGPDGIRDVAEGKGADVAKA